MNSSPPLLAFIVGHSRGGTTWISRCLGKHPDVAVFGETLYWGRKFIAPPHDGNYNREQINQILNRLKKKGITGHGVGTLKKVSPDNVSSVLDKAFSGADSTMTPAQLFLKICQAIATKEQKKWAIEKTPHHLNFADRIKRFMPDVKFIILCREPYGFILSYKHQLDRYTSIDGVEKRRRQRLYHPIICALIWRKYARSVDMVSKKYPGSTHVITLEEIRENPALVLEKAQQFLGLKTSADIMLATVNSSFSDQLKPRLYSEELFWINIIGRQEMRAMKISKQQINYDWLRIVWSILTVPIWCFSFIYNMRNQVEGGLLLYLLHWLRNKPIH